MSTRRHNTNGVAPMMDEQGLVSKRSLAEDDIVVPQQGNDGITSLVWSRPFHGVPPTTKCDVLASSNWDGKVRCWDIHTHQSGAVTATPRSCADHEGSVLDCCFSSDGTTIFSGGCDKALRIWRIDGSMKSGSSNVAPKLGDHDAPIKAVGYLDDASLVVSGGWDKKLKLWDVRRQGEPLSVLELPDRVHSLDISEAGKFMVVATAGRHIIEYNIQGPEMPREMFRTVSGSEYETRIVKAFPSNMGVGAFGVTRFQYAVGSLEGSVCLRELQKCSTKGPAFRAGQDKNHRYSVNAISFHRPTGNVATGLSNGEIEFWDLQKPRRIKTAQKLHNAVACAEFNHDGQLFAYASSYDWSKGSSHYTPGTPNEIFIHRISPSSIVYW